MEHRLTSSGQPFFPMDCCPACGRTSSNNKEKYNRELLTHEENELLDRVARLVKQHRAFLDIAQEAISL